MASGSSTACLKERLRPPGVTVPVITAVSVTHTYDGKPLELVGSYVFGSHVLNNGAPTPPEDPCQRE